MGWQPQTFCMECDEPFDVYHAPGERVCECCAELIRIEAAEAKSIEETHGLLAAIEAGEVVITVLPRGTK